MHTFDNSELEQYSTEARERWGKTDAYGQYTEKTGRYSQQKRNELAGAMDRIMAEFACCMKKGEVPDSAEARALAEKLQRHITEHYYLCTDEILAGLGQMYTADERFRRNIDRHADGTAAYVSAAIAAFCGK